MKTVSTNHLEEKNNVYVKFYGYKKPFFKFIFRSFIDSIGMNQPVEYYNNRKRKEFEYKVLLLWDSYNLNVPKVLKNATDYLELSKIDGKTLEEIFTNSFDLDIVEKVFKDLDFRHSLAKDKKEPLFCHIDSNLKNIIYSDGKIFHIDFEMGREYEKLDKWMEREISKLLYSIMNNQSQENRNHILNKFVEIYSHKDILQTLISRNLRNKKIDESKFRLSNILYDLNDILDSNKEIKIDFEVNKILVIYSGRFGDILLSTPVIRLLKEKWPTSKITYLTHPKRYEILLHNDSFIDKVSYITSKKMGIEKDEKYDLVIILNKDNESFIKQSMKVSKNIISFRVGNYDLEKQLLYTKKYPLQHSMHSVDMRLSLLNSLNKVVSSKKLMYKISQDEDNFASKYLREFNLDNKILIGIQANSFHTKSFRNWSIENFVNLCLKINEDYKNVYFLLFGSEDDIVNISKIKEKINNSFIVAGKVSFRESAAIMSKINLYIGVDTGPTHIVGTMNIPMIVMYHSFASSNLLKPLENKKFIAIDHPLNEHGNDDVSMNDISVEEVFLNVKKVLKDN